MERRDFIKKTALGVAAMTLLGKTSVLAAGSGNVTDNLGGKGSHIAETAPSNTDVIWVKKSTGVAYYYNNGKWEPLTSTWS